jgi:4a-hydroxytetrahydrobiopterin dehydratase
MAKLSGHEISSLMSEVPDWAVITEDGMERLQRVFRFDDFADALDFANRIGLLAEEADHHPRLVVEWGSVGVTWWSHSEGGMVAADIDMAKKVNAI